MQGRLMAIAMLIKPTTLDQGIAGRVDREEHLNIYSADGLSESRGYGDEPWFSRRSPLAIGLTPRLRLAGHKVELGPG
jgi:hypothetical protein